MDRRKIILIITVILIIAIGVVVYFYLTRETKTTNSVELSGGGGSPFGTSASDDTTSNDSVAPKITDATSTEDNIQAPITRLRQLTTAPTSGDIILTKLVDVIKDRVKVKETQYFVRYMDRATGHIFDVKTDSPAPLQVSNTTIPKVYDATFTPDGNSIMTRLLSEVNPDQILTYFVTIKDKKVSITATSTSNTVAGISDAAKTGLKEATGVYLPPDIKEIAISPSGSKVLSLYYTNTGGKITVSNANGTSERTVLTHPLREWLLSMPSEGRAVLTTRPSGIVNGYAYSLDLASGNLTKIMGGIAGLTVLPNKDSSAYLGAGTPSGVVKLFSYIVKGDKQTMVSFSTFPEKCVWANKEKLVAYCAVPQSIPNSVYPDTWYQGRVSFTDDIWKINVSTGETNIVSNLTQESGQKIDAINMKLSDDDTYLTFINKSDLTLWGLNLALKK